MADSREWALVLAAGAVLMLAAGRSALAEVAGLRITSDQHLDTSSIDRIIGQIIKPHMSDREKALAVWRFATDYNYFYPAPCEPPAEDFFAYGVVTDILKLINVYGYGYCFQHCSLVEALWEAAGLEARTGGIGGHAIGEVFYEGQYHYLDSSQKGYCVLADGRTIASRDQVADNPLALVVHQAHPSHPFFPGAATAILPYEDKHILAGYFFLRDFFEQHRKYRTAHSMNLTLPAAGRVTWYWKGLGKWSQRPPERTDWELKNFGHYNPYDGPAERHGRRTYANAVLRFRPDLTRAGEELVEALHASKNVGLAHGGLSKSADGPAYADLRVAMPYVICGWPTVLEPGGVPRGAAVVSGRVQCLERGRVRLLVSTDEGVTWEEVWRVEKPGLQPFAVDFSPQVVGRYGFLLRMEFGGPVGAARIEDLALDLNTQAAQLPLPALVPGRNTITVDLGDETKVLEFNHHFTSQTDLTRRAHDVKTMIVDQWNIHPPTGETGEVTFRIAAPDLHELVWLSVGGAMRTSVPPRGDETAEILVAAGRPSDFRTVWRADVPPYTDHWCHEVDERVDLPAGTRSAYVTYRMKRTGEGAIGVPRIVAHYRRIKRTFPADGLRVTYHWRENGEAKSHEEIVRAAPFTFTITVPAGTAVETDRLVVETVRSNRAPLGEPHETFTKPPKLDRRDFRDPVAVPALQEGLALIRERFDMPRLAEVFGATKSPVLRAQLVAVIAMLGAEANPFLAQRLLSAASEDPDAAVAGRAKRALGRFYEALPDAAQVAALRLSNAERRAAAAEVLGRRGADQARDALVPLLGDGTASVRSAAALALARLGDARAVPRLVGLLETAGPDDATEPAQVLPARLPYAVALFALGDPRGDEDLRLGLASPDRYHRYEVTRALAEAAEAPTADATRFEGLLVRALEDAWAYVRREAVVALVEIGGEASLPAVKRLANADPVPWVRSEAGHAARRIEARVAAARARS